MLLKCRAYQEIKFFLLLFHKLVFVEDLKIGMNLNEKDFDYFFPFVFKHKIL